MLRNIGNSSGLHPIQGRFHGNCEGAYASYRLEHGPWKQGMSLRADFLRKPTRQLFQGRGPSD